MVLINVNKVRILVVFVFCGINDFEWILCKLYFISYMYRIFLCARNYEIIIFHILTSTHFVQYFAYGEAILNYSIPVLYILNEFYLAVIELPHCL